ncbi:histidine kinase N-terminal 7TM domain-containing protein [Halosolutus amylolyticus]|uniref:histidine kinase n=1 Tax=Halosolutus amylolyticus TaxID=2932267 RepID=A0ABD5PNQ2_9EURY|nr:histidine kinase N-terminal 7TM domain-containing protein [Halosolutus amylolyticus]
MGWPVTPYSLVFLCSFVVAVGTATIAWRTRPAPGAAALTAFMGSVAGWLGTHALEIEAASLAWKVSWANVQWLFAAVIPTLFLVFAVQYTGKNDWLTRRRLGLLAIEPLVMIGLVVTNDRANVLWGPTYERTLPFGWTGDPVTVATADPKIGTFVHLGYATLCLLAASILLIDLLVRNERLYRWQGAAVLVSVAVPWGTAVLSASSLEIVGITPLGFTITGLAITFGLYRYRLLELAPIARSAVVETLDDGVLVVDDDRRIVDANPVANDLFGGSDDTLVGDSIGDLVPSDVDSLLESTAMQDRDGDAEAVPDAARFSLDGESGRRYYELSTSTIDDGHGRPIGWTIVVHDVTERERRARELERTNHKLDEFASVVSHDLRNPLTVSRGYLDMLEEEYDPEYVEIIDESHDRMEQLIDDVLALARQGHGALDPGPVSLASVARDAWATVETADATRSVVDDPTIEADRTALQQLLENLFRNAIEHGSSNGSAGAVTVHVGRSEDGVYVADSGTGFDASVDRDRLFESGYSTGTEGTGLGLAIAAEIAEGHGWSIRATESESGGARFDLDGVTVLDRSGTGEDEDAGPIETDRVSGPAA